ncbi:MAG TPA: DUF6531 domain-containing protein [Chloroflexota bacterium]|nr:DUF6531 domain-containing protein [Chloroflexota bacterium]
MTQPRNLRFKWIYPLFSAVLLLASLFAPGSPIGIPGTAHAAGTIVNVQGNWVGTILANRGGGDNCTFSVSQAGTNLSGGGTCQRTGAGSCQGTIDAATMKLECENAFFGALGVVATISTDGTTATGTWTASNGAQGSYKATRRADPSADYGEKPGNRALGGYFYRHTDLRIAGRGIPLVFTRAYNALDPTVGRLGPGWTDSYSVHLVIETDGTPPRVSVVKEDGGHDIYLKNPDGSFSNPSGVYAALTRKADGTYTLTRPDHDVLNFDANGRLTSLADQNGNKTALTYRASGRLTAIADPAGRGSLTLSYDTCSRGRLCGVSDWLSPARAVSFGYDESGRLQTVTDRAGNVTFYAYDRDNLLTTITDANNHRTILNKYDSAGRLAEQLDAKDFVTCVYYGTPPTFSTISCPGPGRPLGANQTMNVDRNGNQTRFTYDSLNRVTEVLDAAGGKTTYAYDSNGNVTSTTEPSGARTDRCFDGNGNLTRLVEPPSLAGQPRRVTVFSYQGFDLLQTTVLGGAVIGNPSDCATAPLAPNVSAIRNSYDAKHNLLSVTRTDTGPGVGTRTTDTHYEYGDPKNPGRVTRMIAPRGNGARSDDASVTAFSYYSSGSQAGLLQSETDPGGSKTTYTYDAVGRRLTVEVSAGDNAAPRTWTYIYDGEDRPLSVSVTAPTVGASAAVIAYAYDSVGNRTVVKDATGQVTKYRYDERESLREVDRSPHPWTDPNVVPDPMDATTYSYDHNGNLGRVVQNASGPGDAEITDYFYDALNRPLGAIAYPRTVGQRHHPQTGGY